VRSPVAQVRQSLHGAADEAAAERAQGVEHPGHGTGFEPDVVVEVEQQPGGARIAVARLADRTRIHEPSLACKIDLRSFLAESERLLSGAGLIDLEGAYVVFFTRHSARLERIERRLGRLPLGAQYVVSARRP